jgi:hypothetical protein
MADVDVEQRAKEIRDLGVAYDLNRRGEELLRAERTGATLYVFQAGIYHPVGRSYDDVRVSLCGKASGRLGRYGVTDDVSGMTLCSDCAALMQSG